MKVKHYIIFAFVLVCFGASAQLYRPGITLHRNWSISADQNIYGSDQLPMLNVLCGYSINPLSGKKTGFLSAFSPMTEDTAFYLPYISMNDNVLYSVAISDGNAMSTTPVVSVGYEEVAIGDRDILINYSDIVGAQPTKSTNHLIISAPYNQEAKFVKQEMPYSFNFWTCGYSEPSAGNKDFWIGKIYADGNTSVLWDTSFGGIGEDVFNSFCYNSMSALFLTGYTSSLPAINKDFNSMIYHPASDSVYFNRTFIRTGDQELNYSFKNNYNQSIISVGYSDTTGSNKDFLIVCFDENSADTMWTRTFGTSENDVAFTAGLADFMVNQCIVVSGYTTTASGDKQNYVVLLNLDGIIVSEKIFGDDLNDDCIYTMFCMPDGCQHFLFGQQGTEQSFYEIVAFDYDFSVTNVSCYGTNDGQVDLIGGSNGFGSPNGLYDSLYNMVGSVGPYFGLQYGKYYMELSYSFPGAKSGCYITDSVYVYEPAYLDATISSVDPDCMGNLGSVTISPTGGTPPYSLSWSTGASNVTQITDLIAGNYDVFVSDANWCSSSSGYYYATLTDQTLATINGAGITSSGFIIENHGKAILYKLGATGTALELDSVTSYTIDLQSMYNFSNVEPGNYKILLQIDSSSYYPNYLNSYYSLNDTVINWDIADTISVACNDNFNLPIKMYEMTAMESGVGSISGHIYLFTYTKQIGEPVPGAEILIEQEPNDVPVQATFTDNSGYYEVNGLEAGGIYSMEVDIPGYPLISSHVNIPITTTDTVYEDMNFYIDTTINGGIMADTLQTQIYTFTNDKFELNAYPNPFNNNVSFEFNLVNDAFIQAEILNVSGEPVKNLISEKRDKGNSIIKWQPQSGLSSGVYFLRVRVDNQILVKKVMYTK